MFRQISDSILKCTTVLSRVGCSSLNSDLRQGPLQIVKFSQNVLLPKKSCHIALLTGNYNFQSCRQYSMYSIKYEKRKALRDKHPTDETPHWPQYMNEPLPNQEDSEKTRQITYDTIQKINTQIEEGTHGRLFAVVHIQGKQFKITQEDVIIIQGYWAPDVGDRVRFEKILLTGGTDFTVLGKPTLPRDLVRIEGTVIEKSLSYTKLRFKMLRRKNYRRLFFYKEPYTMVRINSIEFDGYVNERKDVEGERNTIY